MSRRGFRFPRDHGRGAGPNDMARTMEIFKIPFPPLLSPPSLVTATQNTDLNADLISQDPMPAEQSTNQRGHTLSEPLSPIQRKRKLIRIVTDKELEDLQITRAPVSAEQVPSTNTVEVEGTSRAMNVNGKMSASNVSPSDSLSVSLCENVKVPETRHPTAYVPPVTPVPVGSLKELLAPLLKMESSVVGLTISMRMKDGETLVINGDL